MSVSKRRDGFIGEKQIKIPASVMSRQVLKNAFLQSLYITQIGYFPKAQFHYRERKKGCEDNILIYCLSGKGHYEIPKGKFELKANQFVILPPNQFQRYQADIKDPWSIYWVHFSGARLEDLNQYTHSDKYSEPTEIHYKDLILETWHEMYRSLDGGFSQANLGYANLCLYRFISFFLFPDKTEVPVIEDSLLDKAILHMRLHIQDQLTVDDIANHFNYSASHFTALFKTKTGMAPIEYFIQMKMHYACQLLTQSVIRIKTISEMIGYADPYYFSRIFSKVMGKSPSHYRKQIGTKQEEQH